jgi:hypothetical protein
MDPTEQWDVLTTAYCFRRPCPHRDGGQSVFAPTQYARNNAELVEKIVRKARDAGREIATADSARRAVGLAS